MMIKIIIIKKCAKLEKKIHRSMKRGKMIKMVATGTGARKVVIGWLLCLGAEDFSCRPRWKPAYSEGSAGLFVPERRKSQHLVGYPVALLGPIHRTHGGAETIMVQAGRGARFPEAECCQWRYQAHRVTPGPLLFHTHTPLAPHRCPSLQCDGRQ